MSPRYSYAAIVAACAEETGCAVADLLGESRDAWPTVARHRAFYLARTIRTDLSLPQIGRMTGGRDHTTVLNGVRRIARLILDSNPEQHAIERIKARLALSSVDDAETAQEHLAKLDAAIGEAEARLDAIRLARAQIVEAL